MATPIDKDNVVMTFHSARRMTIPELLASRQSGALRTIHPRDTSAKLSSAVAWNTCRMQNMILAVGPGTPAAASVAQNEHEESSSSSSSSSQDMEQEEHKFEEESDDDMEETDASNNQNNGDGEAGPRFRRSLDLGNDAQSADLVERIVLEYLEAADGADDESEESVPEEIMATGNFVPSVRHGGCINTAAWLTSPWRLSLPGHGASAIAVDSNDCPTQLLTSGDDRTVKFWDVRYAMGTANPIPGGRYAQCPFADKSECELYDWKKHAALGYPLAGIVIPLVSLSTGHRGNVFHVTPVDHLPGKVVTCAADGYLRMADVDRPDESSTIIVSPEYANSDDLLPAGLFLRSGMCFSHHFLNANTGLLCGERGLKRFDLRLSPREQSSRSLLGNDQVCKSCAIWSASSSSSDDIDSAYVFGKSVVFLLLKCVQPNQLISVCCIISVSWRSLFRSGVV